MADACLLRADTKQSGGRIADGELLGRFVRLRDEAAFAELVTRHGPLVMGVCRRVLADRHDAEDAFQATFLVLARKASSIRRGTSLAGWLHRVAYRVAVRAGAMICKRREQQLWEETTAVPEVFSEVASREAQRVLEEELSRLPERYRAPLVLCHLQGKSRQEAAEELGWTEGSLKGRLERGRQRLRWRLALRGVTYSSALVAVQHSQQAAAAALDTSLVASTVEAGLQFATGQGTGGAISHNVGTLADGILSTMNATTFKLAAGILLVAAVVSHGTQQPADQTTLANGSIQLQATIADMANQTTSEAVAMVLPPLTAILGAEGEEGQKEQPRRSRHPQGYAKFKTFDVKQDALLAITFYEGEGKKERSWDVARDAETIIDGKPGKVTQLAEGCNLKLWFSDQAKKHISALEAEGPQLGHRMYGQGIAAVDATKRTITLRVGERPDAVEVRKIAPDVMVTIGGKPAKLSDVKPDRRTWLRLSAKDLKTVAVIRQASARPREGQGERREKARPSKEGDHREKAQRKREGGHRE